MDFLFMRSDTNEEKLLNEVALGGSLAGSDRRETHYKTFCLIYCCLAIQHQLSHAWLIIYICVMSAHVNLFASMLICMSDAWFSSLFRCNVSPLQTGRRDYNHTVCFRCTYYIHRYLYGRCLWNAWNQNSESWKKMLNS